MATSDSTTQTAADTLLNAADQLTEARALVSFFQSMLLNSGHGDSITLTAEQLSGMSYSMQDIIDRIKCAEASILACGYTMDGTTTGKTKQAGAVAACEALRNIEKIAERQQRIGGATLSMLGWWDIEDSAVEAMQSAAGMQNDFVYGFLAALAEYTLSVSGGCPYNLGNWKPEAAMNEAEKKAARAEFEKAIDKIS